MEDIPQLCAKKNEVHDTPFMKKEVFEDIAQMKNNKAPCWKCWGIIKGDLMPMMHDLFNGQLQLNFWTITLLPKKDVAVCIEHFRPICLIKVSFKIST